VSKSQVRKPYTVPSALTLDAHADRKDDGRIVIGGTTNLPDDLKIWVQIEHGRLPKGAPKVVAEDDDVIIKDGSFQTTPLWLEVPNTTFTKTGWPKSVKVDVREKPFPQGPITVHFVSYFNGAWQSNDVLVELGNDEGKTLKGPILKPTDSDVTDSPKVVDYYKTLSLSPVSPEATAIALVRAAVLTVPGQGRSSGDVQANLDLFSSSPGTAKGNGWSTKSSGPKSYQVSYDYIDGSKGDEQAIWTADLSTGAVKYVNESAKIFSWTPNY
jgi:hypothetical protein